MLILASVRLIIELPIPILVCILVPPHVKNVTFSYRRIYFWSAPNDQYIIVVLQAYEEIIISGSMPEEFGQGMIHLIPKSGGIANDMSKWRPITLLNIVYKLLAKIMARCLTPLLPQLIHPS